MVAIFRKFVDRDVHLVEVGIFSGGRLAMWQHCLGERCHLGANCIVRER